MDKFIIKNLILYLQKVPMVFLFIFAVGILVLFYIGLHATIYLSYQGFISIDTGNYTNFIKNILSIMAGKEVNITTIPLTKCPPSCKIDLRNSLNTSKKVIISVDNPYAIPILLAVYYYQNISRISNIFLANKLVIIDYTTLVNTTFDRELHLVTFPLVPFSDITPRYIYVKQSSNFTLNVKAPTIAGFLSPLASVVSLLVGIVSALGIVKHYTRTPATYIMGFSKLELLRIILLVPILLVVILPFYSLFLNVSLDFLHNFLLPFMVLYPPYYVMGKITIFNILRRKSLTVALMEAYDISIILWGLQWVLNPFITISSSSLILAPSIILFSIIITILLMFYLIFPAKNKAIPTTTIFAVLVPFLLNREFIARKELCMMATTTILKTKVYLEGNNYVEGVMVKCSLDKIVIDSGRERRVISWSDVWQIELTR